MEEKNAKKLVSVRGGPHLAFGKAFMGFHLGFVDADRRIH
jgi:hypothetical protein